MDDQLSFWYTGQTVTSSQMSAFSAGIYQNLTEMTQAVAPCILFLNGTPTQASPNADIVVPNGAFRFNNITLNDVTTAVFGNVISNPNDISGISGDGYVVARYTPSNTAPGAFNYTYPTEYLFIPTASLNPVTDCVIVTVENGVMTKRGKYYNIYPIYAANFNFNYAVSSSSYNVTQEENFYLFSNKVFAAPCTYEFDNTGGNAFPLGWSCAVYDNPANQITLSLTNEGGSNSQILGLQKGGYYVIEGGGNSDWVLNYLFDQTDTDGLGGKIGALAYITGPIVIPGPSTPDLPYTSTAGSAQITFDGTTGTFTVPTSKNYSFLMIAKMQVGGIAPTTGNILVVLGGGSNSFSSAAEDNFPAPLNANEYISSTVSCIVTPEGFANQFGFSITNGTNEDITLLNANLIIQEI